MNPNDMAQQMQQLKGFYQPGMAGAAPGGLGTAPQMPAGGPGQPQPQGGMMGALQGYQAQMQPQVQPFAQPSVGQQYQSFMSNGGQNPALTVGKPTTDDEWRQKLYMDQKYKEMRDTEMSQFLQERDRRGGSG